MTLWMLAINLVRILQRRRYRAYIHYQNACSSHETRGLEVTQRPGGKSRRHPNFPRWQVSAATCWVSKSLCSASSTRLSTWHCPHLLESAVLRRHCCWSPAPVSVDRYVLPAMHSAANPPHAAAAVECRTTGQTDGRTDARPLRRPCSCGQCQ